MIADNEEEVKLDKSLDLIVYATENAIRILDRSNGEQLGTNVYCELKPDADNGLKFTEVRHSGDKLLVSLQSGTIKHCKLTLSEDCSSVTLSELSKLEMGSEISSMCIADDFEGLDLLYVTLYDAPHYSLNVISFSTDELRLLARMPLSACLESLQTRKFYQHQLVRGGQVFSQFNGQKKASAMLSDLPAAHLQPNQEEAGEALAIEERMEVDATATQNLATHQNFIAMQLNCCAARSMEHLTVASQETDLIIIGFANGKLMQVCLDLAHVKGMVTDPVNFPAYLNF